MGKHRHLVSASAAAALLLLVQTGGAEAQRRNLVVGAGVADVTRLDPHMTAAGADKGMLNWIFNGLVRIRPGQSNPEFVEPDLAESWTSEPGGRVWTFRLRQGVQCHGDHGEFTSEDAVFSLRRAATPATSSFAADFAAVEAVEAVDRYTVRVRLRQVIPSLLGLLSNYHGGMMVCRRAAAAPGDAFARHPIGTGPFAFAEHRPQQFVRLVANRAYFRGAPQLDEIVYRFIPSDATRDLAFQSGEVDLVFGRQDDTWVRRMRAQPGVTVVGLEPPELNLLHLNASMPPLNDIRVRRAVALSIDRRAMVQLLGPAASREAVSVIPSGSLGLHTGLTLPAADLEEARRLLAEAGHRDGVTLVSVHSTHPSLARIGEAVQAQLRRAGINLDLRVVDHATYHANIRQNLSGVTLYQAARFPVADVYLTQFFHSRSIVGTPTAVTNFSHCRAADAEIEAARSETDPQRQIALWRQAQEKILAELCAVPLSEQLNVWAWREGLDFGAEMVGSLNLVPHITERTRFTR